MSLKDLDRQLLNQPEHRQIKTTAEVLAGMRNGKKTTSTIKMGDQEIPVRILSADEIIGIRTAAKLKRIAMVHGDETDESYQTQKLTLLAASDVTGIGSGILSESLLHQLTLNEMTFLYDQMINFWDEFNPSIEVMTSERFRDIVDALKKNRISWSDCSMEARKAIFTDYVAAIQAADSQTLPKGN